MTNRGSSRWIYILLIAIAVVAGLTAYSLTRTQNPGETDNEADIAEDARASLPVGNNAKASQSPVASIRGKVVDERGKPVAGAQVCASVEIGAGLSLVEQRRRHCTHSDIAGRFSFDELAPVKHIVAASARARVPTHLEAWAENNPTREITLQLRTGGVPVRGQVLDLSGGEVAGAWVSVSDGPAGTMTDDTGAFELWSAAGRRYLSATADGYVPGAAEISAPTDEAKIYMAPESSVHGKVINADTGEPLAGVSIRASLETRIWSSALALSYGGSTVTDDAGNFEIDGLTAGRFVLVVDDREDSWMPTRASRCRIATSISPRRCAVQIRTAGSRPITTAISRDASLPGTTSRASTCLVRPTSWPETSHCSRSALSHETT